jgi:hypothetical protein
MTQTPAPAMVHINITTKMGSFDIFGVTPKGTMRTSFNGYTALAAIGDASVSIKQGSEVGMNGIFLSFFSVSISDNAALLVFRLRNENDTVQSANIAVMSDIFFDDNDGATVTEVYPGMGFVISSTENALSFVLRNSELVTDVSRFWFGVANVLLDNIFSQTPRNFINVPDSAFSFSWMNVVVEPGTIETRTVIGRFGVYGPKFLNLTLEFPNLADGVLHHEVQLRIPGQVVSDDGTDRVAFFIMIDGDVRLLKLNSPGRFSVNSRIEVPFCAADYEIGGGRHVISFYAIDEIGNPSVPQSFTAVFMAPTATRSASIPLSSTATPALTPRPNVAMLITNTTASFEITGILGESIIRTSGRGYNVVLRINGSESQMEFGAPVMLSGVTLMIGWRYISTNAAILSFYARNDAVDPRLIDIAVWTDILLGSDDSASCVTIPGRRGFTIVSNENALTFITSGYPFVTNTSTFWFGWFHNLTNEIWNEVEVDEFIEFDSAMAFTWQNLTIARHVTVTKSVIVRFGRFETSRIDLRLSFPLPTTVYCYSPFTIFGSATAIGRPTDLAMRVFVRIEGELTEVKGTFTIGMEFTLQFVPALYGIVRGSHALEFFAVDADGDVSKGRSTTVIVTDVQPSKTPSEDQLRRTATEPATSSGSNAVIVTVSVLSSLLLVGVIACLVRWQRRRCFHKADEQLDDGSAVTYEGAEWETGLMAN